MQGRFPHSDSVPDKESDVCLFYYQQSRGLYMTDLKDYRLEPPEYPEPPACPACGSETYHDIYIGTEGVVGCDECVRALPAEEWWEELEEEKKWS